MNSSSMTTIPDAVRVRPTTVAVVDDNRLIRLGLRSLLDADSRVHVVGEAADGEAAISLVRQTQPDVVLLDVRMPRRDGVSALADICRHSKVLMLTYSDAPEVVRAALEDGATGYLVHGQFRAEDLVGSVLAAAAGSAVMSPAALSAVRSALSEPVAPLAASRPQHDLSSRETEVMELIAQGLSNAQIARRCYLSEKTVKNHVNHIFAKLAVRSRAQAVSRWLGG